MTNYQSLQVLCTYLNISKNRINRDPDFNRSIIKGRKGYIYVQDGYFVVVENATKKGFTWIRNKHLAFMELTRIIIDDQPLSTAPASVSGEFRLNRMPTSTEAAAIRKALQLRERRILTEEQKQALRARFRKGALTAEENKTEDALKRQGNIADSMALQCVGG